MAWERRGRRPLLTLAFLLVISFRVKADDLEVKRLQRIDTNSINIFCTTTNGVTPDDAKDQYELKSPPSGPISLVSTSQASSNPQVFEVNVEDLLKEADGLHAGAEDERRSGCQSVQRYVSGVKASWVGARKLSEPGEVLRLYGHPVRVLACPEGGEDNKDCLDFPKEESYQASSGLSGAAAVLCVPTEGDPAVPFCLVTVDITTAAGITYGGEVRLSHQEDQTAPAEGTLSVAKDIGAGEKRDLLYWSDGRLLACLGTTSCMIQDFPSSNNQYDVFFVDYQEADGEITGASLVMKFEDYSPIGTVIEPNTLEMRWTQTRNQYKLLLTDIEGQEVTITEPPFTSAVVNCEDMKECFGYFINLPPGDFKVMVRPWTGSNMLEENSVLSSKQTIQNSKSKSSDLKIQEVHLDWSSDGSKAFPKVCFTNKAVTSKNLSHFELVIVDQKGHWIRSRGATQKTEGVTCFTGVTLSSDELLIPGKVTVIVIERDLDGLNVVASAHAEAFFKRSLDLVITKFEITDIKSQKFSIHYTGPSGTLSGGELSAMNIDAARIINMELTGVSETRADFEASDLLMSWIKHQTQLTWVLRLHVDDGNFVYGEEQFTFPDVVTFPTCDPAHLIGKKQVVRISCDSHSLETDTIQMTDDDLAIQASTGVVGVSYHLLDKPATLPASIQLCRKPVDNGNVDICTRQVELKDATAGVTAMTEIKVEYEAKITVQHTPSDGNSLDGLVYYYQEDPNPPTLKYCPRADCEVQGYIGVQDLEVLVVYKDDTTGKSVESEQRTVYGLELRGAQITSTVSELAIKKMPERDVYQVIIENSTSPGMEVRSPTFTTVKVMCQDVEIVCYAYLPLTAGGKYKATVSPYEDKAGEGAPDKMNQIVSLEMTPLQYKEKRDTEVPKNLVLKQINRVKSDTATFGTDVTVFNDLEPVDGIASVTLVVTHENGDGTGDEHLLISTEVGDGIIEQGVEKVFHFDINPVDNILSPPTTVLFIAKNKDNVALAVAEITVEFKTLDPAMDWVGGADTAPLRVKTDLDVEINGVPFAAGTSYSLDFESDPKPVEVCVTLDNTDPAGGTVRQCDLTRSIGSYKDMDVDEVELNNDDAKRVMTVKSTFGGMEAVLYKEEDNGIVGVTFSCAIENTCSSEISDELMVELSRVFKVLVVGKDGADLVTGAKVVDFEDFQTYVQRFSDGSDLEVRWEASNNNGFTVQLDNDVPDGFTDVAVQCGGAEQRACKAYFTNLKADASYKAKVIKENTAVSFTTPPTAGSAVPLSITQLSEVSTNPLQMELKFSVDADVTGVEYIEYVVIDPPVDGEAEQRIVFKDTTEDIKTGDNSITFDDAELPDAGAGSTVLAVVHGPGGVLAAGKVVAAFKAINPTMSWVGEANTAPLRVKTDLAVEINGVLFAAGTSYSLDFESAPNPVEVCATLENTAPAGGTVRQCDMTRSIQDFQELNVDNIELNYDAGKHVMTVSSTFAGMEAVLYHGGDTGIVSETFSCDTPDTCSSDISGQIPGLSSTFKVLVVGVDAGAVTGANVVDFVDFQVRVQRFSAAGDLEVRWRADSAETYEIHLDADVPDGFTDVSVACGGADNRACKAYFTKLEADKPYKAELQRGITVVSATVPAIPESGIPVTITKIAQVSKDPLQTQLTVTADTEVIGIEYLEFVVIEPLSDNEATQHMTFKSVNCIINVDTTAVFDVEELPSTGVELTLLFVVHGRDGVDSEALAAGKVVVTLADIKPTINWVGGQDTAPLRIHANQELLINNIQFPEGTFYLLDFDASSNIEICVTLDNTAATGTTLNQCDLTQTPQNVADMEVQKVELSHEAEGKSTITVSSTFTSMEAVMYNAGESGKVSESFSCVTENTCSSDVTTILAGLKTTFKFLAVGVADPDAVSGAKLIDVEDFQTSALRFSDSGVVEVRWRASSDQLFNVHVNNEVSEGFTDVSVQCGGSEQRACKAYYTMLKANMAYKAEVQKDIVAVSTAVPATTASVTTLNIARISKMSESPIQTQLTVSAATEVTGIQYVDFVMIDPPKDNIAPQHIAFSEAPDSIDANSCIITFDDTDQPKMLVGVTVLVVAHGAEGSDSDILASGEVLVYFADLVPPKMTKVGSEETKSLKVENGDLDVRVNGNVCRAKSVCYFLESDTYLEPPEVCRDTGSGVEQCDMTGSYVVKKLLAVTGLDLMDKGLPEKELRVTADFDANSVTMETMIYDDAGIETSTPLTCNIESASCVFPVAPQNTIFKILLMALDNKAGVVESNTIEFEDFQTRMEQLTNTDLEVSWKSSQASNFTITMNPPPEGFPSVLTVECGGEQPEDSAKCLAFFLLLPEGAGCTANVNRKGDDAKTVSAFLQLEIAEGFSAPITITRLIARERAGKKPSLSVCFKDELFANGKGGEVMTRAGSPKYSLVVVDAFGRQLLSPSDLSSLSSSSSVEDDLCFGDLSLGFDFDLRQKLKVIVKREEMEGERVRAVGDIEAHLLDPRGLIDVRQVGPRTVRVGWKDVHRALGYEVLIGALRLAGGCDGEQDPQCVRYLHVDRGESPLVVTLKAVDARVSQEVEVPLPLLDMSMCFNPAPKASHYLLSLEDEKGLVLESRRVFPQQEDDFTCVLSAEEVDLGGYLSLRTLVTAFDASDMPVASGTATIQEFFLSPKRKVLNAVNETNHDLITTWHLLDDPEKITSYYVTLERATDGRKNDPVVLSSTVTSHVFEGVAPGRYSVCVAASVEDAGSILRSREVCSDIFSVPGVDVEIPEVAEVKVKTTGLDKALVTWQKPGDEDDVTNYVITWTKAAPSSNSAVSSTSNQARPRHPLPIVAQGFRDVEPDFRDQGRHHRIVPASSPSVEVLTLDPKKAYEVCVSAVRKGVAGNHVCKGVQLGKDDPVDSPTDLVFENDLLKWNGVVSASGYLVEWRPRRGGISSGGQEEVKTTSWTSGNLSPGRWVVSVRATTETSASKPVSADYLKEGIEIVSAVQPNNNQLLIRWQEEPRPPCAESKCHYAITTSYNQAPLWHSCSGLKGDCERAIEVQGGTQVEVALERDGVKSSRKEMVFAFPGALLAV
ncbi:hypothetical protein C7M84_009145 [Penaeus vannamei]|uniref:Fibronectin type-III domain-containing protein n=1 Tax=Penaeus vannamei TaxID=6689 RepID=A0A3R7PHX2_PENVA|nr:hypothetical protein C7M84_009145 [Penaeus vannamei]